MSGYHFSISFTNVPSGFQKDSTACCLKPMIHAIASSQGLIHQFENLQKKNNESKNVNNLLDLLHGLNLKKSDTNLSNNTKLLENLLKSLGMETSTNQDLWNTFTVFINRIYNDFKSKPNEPKINMPMEIETVHRITEMGIHNKDDRKDDTIGISVSLCGNYKYPPGVPLQYLLDQHLNPTDKNESKKPQILFYKEAPAILLIHIQTDKLDAANPKFHIEYDDTLSLDFNLVPDFNSTIEQKIVNYKIQAIINRVADNDYVTYRKWEKKWYKVHNDNVSTWDFDKSIVPCVLIYKKMKMRKFNLLRK